MIVTLFLATLLGHQSPDAVAEYVSLPGPVTSRHEALVHYPSYGPRLVPVLNNFVPEVREYTDDRGRQAITYDYSRRIPLATVRTMPRVSESRSFEPTPLPPVKVKEDRPPVKVKEDRPVAAPREDKPKLERPTPLKRPSEVKDAADKVVRPSYK